MKLFGRKKKKPEEEKPIEVEEEEVEQPIAIDYYARYIGGPDTSSDLRIYVCLGSPFKSLTFSNVHPKFA